MFNLTIRGHDLFPITTPEELAEKTSKIGISNLQFSLDASFSPLNTSASAINPGMGTYFKNTFSQKNVQIALLSCYSNLIHPDPNKREEILLKFESFLQHASFFGASMVASETGSVIPELGYSTDNFSDDVFDDLVSVIKRLVKKGESCGTLVGIEAGLNHPLYSVERTKQLVDLVPSDYLGIILDPTNLITVETSENIVDIVQEAFDLYGSKICALHLKDYIVEDGKIIPVPLGKGIIKYQEILEIVNKHKPYCYIVLEETTNENIITAQELLNK